MKYIDNRKSKYASYRDLSVGDVFFFADTKIHDKEPHMKIQQLRTESGHYIQAINLHTGQVEFALDNTPVIPCEAVMEIIK